MKEFPELYRAGRITRWHTADLPAQELGQHQWGVAMVVRAIYPNGKPPGYLLETALTHDLAELVTGDVPSTVKWGNPELVAALKKAEETFNDSRGLAVDLSDRERQIIAWADMFELCLYCDHHARMGNGYAAVIRETCLKVVRDQLGFPTTESKELFDHVFG